VHPRLLLLPLVLGACAGDPSKSSTASITIRDRQQAPVAGARVAFEGADGRLLDTITTGADGTAIGPMEDGGMLTFLFSGEPDYRFLFTVAGVQVDDHVDYVPRADASPDVGTLHVTLPAALPHADLYGVCLRTYCEYGDPGATMDVFVRESELDRDGTVDVSAGAFGDQGILVGWSVVRGVALGSNVSPPAWSTTFTEVPVHVTGFPEFDSFSVQPSSAPVGDSGALLALAGGSGSDSLRVFGNGTGDLALDLLAQSYDDVVAVEAIVTHDRTSPIELTRAMFLAPPTAPTVDAGTVRPTVSWSMPEAPDGPDRTTIVVTEPQSSIWTAVVPPTSRSFTYPELPDDFADAVAPGSELFSLTAYDQANTTWEQARAHLFGFVPQEPGYRMARYGL
jgi:hypothetical protein